MSGHPDVCAWEGVVVGGHLDGGNRSDVWAATSPDGPVAVRRSRRSSASLDWEIELLDTLATNGFLVPVAIPTVDGTRYRDGVVVQRWIDGRPPSSTADWRLVADELGRLHAVTAGYPQRPGCVTCAELERTSRSVDANLAAIPADIVGELLAVFAEFADAPTSVIHGDPGPSNIRITDDGRVGLIDWDESRVDCVFHDLSNLGVQVLADADHFRARRLSHAWEAANAWTVEPDYARRRLAQLH